jgi:arylsulfatase A-like enzyme/Flp pilus assembly protein TadD
VIPGPLRPAGPTAGGRAFLFVLAAGPLVAGGCGSRPAQPAVPRHLVVVTIDTLRADRLGCYGGGVATPHLDRLAGEGALAPDATVHVPLTRPSHVSLFTGLYPAEHGIRDNVSPALGSDVPVLAETLKAAGFETAAFVSSVVVSRQSGLARGFDVYSDRFQVGGDDARFLNTIQRRGDGPTDEAVAWLSGRGERRLFVWLHLYDPHDPYEPPEPYASRYGGRPYDGEVAWSDELVGRLDAALQRAGLSGSTLLVVTSDHGEGLGEHGEPVHGFFIYETTLKVPFLARGPGIKAGARPAVTFRAVDLYPTLLELMGLPPPTRVSGRSLAGPLRGDPAPAEEATYAESLTPLLHYGWSDLRSIREGRWKYIQAPRPELYDLRHDPAETRDLATAEPARAEALRTALARRLAAEREREGAGPAAGGVPQELLEQLGALGYVGLATPGGRASTGADPKDKIEDYKALSRLVREGLVRLRERDYAGSAERLQQLLARGADSFEVRYYLGRALAGLGRHRDAAAHFREAIRRLPSYGAAYRALSESLLAAGDAREALATLRRGQEANPRDARLHEAEARLLRGQGRVGEALKAAETAARLAPKDALVRVQLGELLRDSGRPDRAVAVLREAVSLDPEPASYWNSLGMVLGGTGRFGEAEAAFRQAVQREGSNHEYVYNLGLALLKQERAAEAAPLFRRALELAPAFRPARDRLGEIARRP